VEFNFSLQPATTTDIVNSVVIAKPTVLPILHSNAQEEIEAPVLVTVAPRTTVATSINTDIILRLLIAITNPRLSIQDWVLTSPIPKPRL
jgi:hypothetical protein